MYTINKDSIKSLEKITDIKVLRKLATEQIDRLAKTADKKDKPIALLLDAFQDPECDDFEYGIHRAEIIFDLLNEMFSKHKKPLLIKGKKHVVSRDTLIKFFAKWRYVMARFQDDSSRPVFEKEAINDYDEQQLRTTIVRYTAKNTIEDNIAVLNSL